MQQPTIVRGKLLPTKTYSARWWTWLTFPYFCADGVLTLGQITEKSGDVDEQSYAIEEVRSSFSGGRSFGLRKLGAVIGGVDEQYTCTILPRNSVCNCSAGRAKVEVCRHRDSLKAILDAGLLPVKKELGA